MYFRQSIIVITVTIAIDIFIELSNFGSTVVSGSLFPHNCLILMVLNFNSINAQLMKVVVIGPDNVMSEFNSTQKKWKIVNNSIIQNLLNNY